MAIARLIRVEYCLLGALGVIGGGLLINPAVPSTPLLVSAMAVFLVAAGCYALDDYFDRETDTANLRTDRPLVQGSPSPRVAAIVGACSFTLALVASALAAPSTLLFVAAGAVAAMVYNRWLQGIPLVKNALLAGAFPTPILIGGFAAGGASPLLLYAASLAYVLGLGFEIMIDIGDVRGDLETGVVTLSTTRGTATAARVSSLFLLAGATLAVLPLFLPVDSRLQWDAVFAVLSGGAGMILAVVIWRLLSPAPGAPILGLKLQTFAALHLFVLGYVLGVLR